MKIIIAGSRKFNDYALLKKTLDEILIDDDNYEIVSGCCSGADKLGERYAVEKGFRVKHFPADWDKFGKAAGPIRNALMADYADGLVLFWDGTSKGSKNMLENARKRGLEIKEVII